jgi:hypothetical protein
LAFTVARDANGALTIRVLVALGIDHRAELCRVVDCELRKPGQQLVLDFGRHTLTPAAVSAVLRIQRLCAARAVSRMVITAEADALRQVLSVETTDTRLAIVPSEPWSRQQFEPTRGEVQSITPVHGDAPSTSQCTAERQAS